MDKLDEIDKIDKIDDIDLIDQISNTDLTDKMYKNQRSAVIKADFSLTLRFPPAACR